MRSRKVAGHGDYADVCEGRVTAFQPGGLEDENRGL